MMTKIIIIGLLSTFGLISLADYNKNIKISDTNQLNTLVDQILIEHSKENASVLEYMAMSGISELPSEPTTKIKDLITKCEKINPNFDFTELKDLNKKQFIVIKESKNNYLWSKNVFLSKEFRERNQRFVQLILKLKNIN